MQTSRSFPGVETNELLIWSVFAIQQALKQVSGFPLDETVGLILATTTGLTKNWEDQLMAHFRDRSANGYVYHPLGSFVVELQNQLNHRGPVQLVSSACCAGTQAIGMGQQWIRRGFVDHCIVLGAEQICQLTSSGFRALSLVTGDDCFPFNESHNTICLSESVAALCLSGEDVGALAEVKGYGCSMDGHSMTAPKPDGSGPYQAIAMALRQAQLKPDQVDWIHAHGTGSVQNDRAEAAAINKLGLHCPVTSTKAVHGHSLAASGVLESILCVMALQKGLYLPTWGSEPSHFTINVSDSANRAPLRSVLKNTLGFGGINASLVFSEVQAHA
jgi:3-oxoacyl-(acyl-carrier-protein) synthase